MTKKITKLTPAACKQLRDVINNDLAAPLAALGFQVHAGNAKYDDGTVTFQVKVTLEGFDEERADFDSYCGMFGLVPEDFGAEIRWGGEVFTLAGLKPNRPKWPILGARAGKLFKLPERSVKALAAPTA